MAKTTSNKIDIQQDNNIHKNKLEINNINNNTIISIDGKILYNAKIIKSKNLLGKDNSITIEIKNFDLNINNENGVKEVV